ncbi:MAG TPA: zf-TFIIB domain-containing protein [Baekduia sp.]
MSDVGRHREPLRCPGCGTRLVGVERADVVVDACPDCRGVWLNRDQLDKILLAERRVPRSPRAPDPRDHDHDYYDAKRQRRRSFLEDLLDGDRAGGSGP